MEEDILFEHFVKNNVHYEELKLSIILIVLLIINIRILSLQTIDKVIYIFIRKLHFKL